MITPAIRLSTFKVRFVAGMAGMAEMAGNKLVGFDSSTILAM